MPLPLYRLPVLNGDQIAKLKQQSSSASMKEDIEDKLSCVFVVVAHCRNELHFPHSHFRIYCRSTDGSISDINFLHDSLRKYNSSKTEEVLMNSWGGVDYLHDILLC